MLQRTLVMKFGGTSIGSVMALLSAVQIIRDARAHWPRLVIVTSAMSGVTDLLLQSASDAAQGNTTYLPNAEKLLRDMHFGALEKLVEDETRCLKARQGIDELIMAFGSLCDAIALLGEASPRALDAVASLGERMSVRLLAAIMRDKGIETEVVEATEFIVTNDRFQNAHPDFAATASRARSLLNPVLDRGVVPVTTGFIAATPQGIATTLGRGGSDYSAAIIGAVLPADDVWICTDVDGVMTADPRLVPSARTLPEITFREIAELANYGAKVLHPKTIQPVVKAGIGLRICNTLNPSHPGTRLIADSPEDDKLQSGEGVVRAVTTLRKQRLVTVEGQGMLGVPGVAARAFAAVASVGASVPLITQASSEQSICIALPAESAAPVMQALEKAFAGEIQDDDINRVWATDDVSIVTVVGTLHRPALMGRVFSKLGQNNVNVLGIAQSSSAVSISIVVAASDTEIAVNALHELIIGAGV